MKYSFLEFDEQALLKEIIGKEVYTVSAIAGAKYQHSKDTAIFKQLIEIIKVQKVAIGLASGAAMAMGNKTLESVLDKTLAAVEKKLKELNEK